MSEFEEERNLTQELYKKSKEIIPGGTQLLSKRPEMFAPEQWLFLQKKWATDIHVLRTSNLIMKRAKSFVQFISLALKQDKVSELLKGPVAHAGFRRLN